MRAKRKQQGFFLNPYRFGGGGAGLPGEPQWGNVALLMHLNSRPFMDSSDNLWPVVNYGARYFLNASKLRTNGSGGLVAAPAGVGLGVFNSDPWMISAKITHTSSSAGGVKVRLIDTRSTVGSVPGILIVISSSNVPFVQINTVSYGNGTPAANLTTADNVEYTITVSYDGAVLRLFVDGALSWAHTVALNITHDGPVTIGNTPDFANGIANIDIRELIIVKGEAVYTAAHTPVASWTDTGAVIEAHPNPASYANVKLNLHGSSLAHDSTTFTDVSSSPKTLTANGNVKATTAQFRIGTSSIVFDGTGDFISTPNHADFNFGTGEFSVELQARNGGSTGDEWISNYQNSTNGWALYNNGGTAQKVDFNVTGDGADIDTVDALVTTNTWKHIAACRALLNGVSFLMMLVEGELVRMTENSANITSTQALNIGRLPGFTTLDLNGHLQELRVIKGECPFRRSFIVQTAAHPDS